MGNCASGGATGSAGASRATAGSADGVFVSNQRREVTAESVGGRMRQEVLMATTDDDGNLFFERANPETIERTSSRRNYFTYNLLAGAVDGETFNIDWSKVRSISGKTYSLRDAAKDAGLSWDKETKKWVRKDDTLPHTTQKKIEAFYKAQTKAASGQSRVSKEREYDRVHNEGGEGYNPYRQGSTPTYWKRRR